ncbi:hypothetical protein ACJA28_03080 [Mesomycoplasma moatsii]|uniref:hypothetical protein n=1 Tax=Mesomycoplasma moatsii TaxID=171287 RepID=UPI00387397BC
MTKQYIWIWEFCSFLILFTLVNIVFFFQTTLYRFKKVKFDLEKYPNFNFEIINQKLDLNNISKFHFSRFDYWSKQEIINEELNIKYLGSKQGIYFFEYQNPKFAIFTYSLMWFLLNKFKKDDINFAITNTILDFVNKESNF